jgi:hypothetical protein
MIFNIQRDFLKFGSHLGGHLGFLVLKYLEISREESDVLETQLPTIPSHTGPLAKSSNYEKEKEYWQI